MESGKSDYKYSDEVTSTLDTTDPNGYSKLAADINANNRIKIVVIQHEFGFFHKQKAPFLNFLYLVEKPIVTVFHTVLPTPNEQLKQKVQNIAHACSAVVVMTNHAAELLQTDYEVAKSKITVIVSIDT